MILVYVIILLLFPSTDPILSCIPAQLSTAVLRLQLSEVFACVHAAERDILLLPVLGLLRIHLYLEEGKRHAATAVDDPELGQSERRHGESEQREDTKRKREKRLIRESRTGRRRHFQLNTRRNYFISI